MKRIKFDPKAIKETLEKNKERSTKKREKIPIHQNPILKVEEAGDFLFRAVYYPHSEDPTCDPFPMRHYHYGIPGGVVYCPQLNAGEPCALCDFLWDQMTKNKGNKPAVKVYSDKLPKATLWVPGKLRGREDEGCKLLKIGTRADKMSENHAQIYKWFEKSATANWLDPDTGFDMIITYEEYDETKAKMLNAKIGLKKLDLERDASSFGEDFDDFEVPDIDDSPDDQVLGSYRKRTAEEVMEVLEAWTKKLKTSSSPARTTTKSDVDTGADEEIEDEEISEEDIPSANKSSLEARLKNMGIKV